MSGLGDERLWTVEEIANELDVHIVTVRRWIRSGRLIAMAFGGKTGYRIKDSDLRQFLDGMRTGEYHPKMAA